VRGKEVRKVVHRLVGDEYWPREQVIARSLYIDPDAE
jgi:hypothetical protein